MKKVTLFLSCVSDEFHKEDKALDPQFVSWRTYLELHLNGLERAEFVIITQESALQNEQGDLLEILEQVVERSDYVIHLYGDLPGASPNERSLRRLRERHPDFLSHEPEIRAALPDWPLISYTQWELYFAYHARRSHPLIYLVEDDAPRSPLSRERRDLAEAVQSRERHLQVIRASGQLRPRISNRHDLALQLQTYLLKQGAFEKEGWVKSSAAMLASARANLSLLLPRLADRLGVGRGPAAGGARPVRPVQYLEAVEAVAEEAGIHAAEFVTILEDDLEGRWQQALQKPRFAEFHELALTWLAMGDLPHARQAARHTADHALRRMNEAPQPATREQQRENALNALLLLHDIARLDHDIAAAMAALKEGSPLMDYQADPVAWADYHMLMAGYAQDKGYHEEALRWLWGQEGASEAQDQPGIMDAYEEAFGRANESEETEERLADALFLLAEVCNGYGESAKALPFAGRARRIYERAGASGLYDASHCWLAEDFAYRDLGLIQEALKAAACAEEILSKLHEQHPGHQGIKLNWAQALDRIGLSHSALGDHHRALEFQSRALAIDEALLSQEPGNANYQWAVGMRLDFIGRSHLALGAHHRALEFQSRALAIHEALLSQEPGNANCQLAVGFGLDNIGRSHADLGDHHRALEFQSCALTIREALCGQFPTHLRYQRDLYLSGLRAGRALRNLGQIKAARQHLLRVQEIARALQKTSYRYYKMPSEWTEIQTELALLDAADTPASSPLD